MVTEAHSLTNDVGDEMGSKAVLAGEDDSFISGRVLVSEFPPQAHFDFAKRWLGQCEANHRECCDYDSELPELPMRVICVTEEGQTPYLMNGNGKRARYATLSHCWGRSIAVTTVRGSLRTRQTGIPLESLPKTFRDAIVGCRKLGVPFLWIDSLCILQDDKDDWERESSHMGSIYSDSTLTLAATDSSDSSEGLFIPQRPCEIYHKDIVTLPPSFGNYKGQAYLTTSTWPKYGPPDSYIENGILQTRGWVMQEKYLARRTLHFLVGQMVWVCCERILGQSGFNESFKNSWRKSPRMQMKAFTRGFERSYQFAEPGEDDDGDDELEDEEDGMHAKDEDYSLDEETEDVAEDEVDEAASETSPLITVLISPGPGRASSIIDLRDDQYQTYSPPTVMTRQIDNELYTFLDVAAHQTIYHVWYSAVAIYSKRRLTFASDKLPALAGIASRVQAITHDQYLAGHWRREVERSLFWKTTPETDTWSPARVKTYRAPSWSWASIDGSTLFNFANLAPGMDEPSCIEVLEASTEVNGGNLFGCVTSGNLLIKASIVRATWNTEHQGWMLSGTFADPVETHFRNRDLKIFSVDGSCTHRAGAWYYDDILNGLIPDPPQRVPLGYFETEAGYG